MKLKKLNFDNKSEIKFLHLEKVSEYEDIDFSSFLKLEELWISSKTKYNLPKSFISIPVIRKLILDKNCRLPENIDEIKTLEELWLEENGVFNIPNAIKNCSSIRKLNISYYDKDLIPTISPSWIFEISSLEKLRFSVCKFSEFNIEKNKLKKLSELDFGCSLSDLNYFPNLSSFTNLKKIIVSAESVQGQKQPNYQLFEQILESIKNLNQIEELDISYWKSKKKMDSLIFKNGKTSIPNVFDRYPNLVKLSVANMKLDFIPETILNLKKLKELKIQGNNLTSDDIKNIIKHIPQCRIESDLGFYRPRKK